MFDVGLSNRILFDLPSICQLPLTSIRLSKTHWVVIWDEGGSIRLITRVFMWRVFLKSRIVQYNKNTDQPRCDIIQTTACESRFYISWPSNMHCRCVLICVFVYLSNVILIYGEMWQVKRNAKSCILHPNLSIFSQKLPIVPSKAIIPFLSSTRRFLKEQHVKCFHEFCAWLVAYCVPKDTFKIDHYGRQLGQYLWLSKVVSSWRTHFTCNVYAHWLSTCTAANITQSLTLFSTGHTWTEIRLILPVLVRFKSGSGPLWYINKEFCRNNIAHWDHCKDITTRKDMFSLQWRHNGRDSVSNHQRLDYLLNSFFRRRKQQSSASLAFVRGIHRWPVTSPHKGPATRKMFSFDDVIISQASWGWKECMSTGWQ